MKLLLSEFDTYMKNMTENEKVNALTFVSIVLRQMLIAGKTYEMSSVNFLASELMSLGLIEKKLLCSKRYLDIKKDHLTSLFGDAESYLAVCAGTIDKIQGINPLLSPDEVANTIAKEVSLFELKMDSLTDIRTLDEQLNAIKETAPRQELIQVQGPVMKLIYPLLLLIDLFESQRYISRLDSKGAAIFEIALFRTASVSMFIEKYTAVFDSGNTYSNFIQSVINPMTRGIILSFSDRKRKTKLREYIKILFLLQFKIKESLRQQ